MRSSQFLLKTFREDPVDAETISHKLMLRSGMIYRLASGLYTWGPLGWRCIRLIEQIVREEMNAAGALEMAMPMVQPADLWQDSGRWRDYGPELLRLKDRHQRDFCLGPTHEEVITDFVRAQVSSYKCLPLNFYQIQTKFRDEVRPRYGIMRSREFIMKDAYSFHVSQSDLRKTYEVMRRAYCNMFVRMGLDFRCVSADSGAIGGSVSHEFHVLADSGEDTIAFSSQGEYAANTEVAEDVWDEKRAEPQNILEKKPTPGVRTIADLISRHGVPIEKTIKTLIVKARDDSSTDFVALLVRGDDTLNPVKAEKIPAVASPLRFADEQEIRDSIGAGPGSLGPLQLPIPCYADRRVMTMSDFSAGANEDDFHYFNINWQRDVGAPIEVDLRLVRAGDRCVDGGEIQIRKGVEVGHIFQLGDKYSRSMGLEMTTGSGETIHPLMGCYGAGISRLVAAAVEQNHDAEGIVWPPAIAPFSVAIIPIGPRDNPQVAEAAEAVYREAVRHGFRVLLDDRDERPGIKFADMDLIGASCRLVVSKIGLEKKEVEFKNRRTGEIGKVAIDKIISFLRHFHSASS